MGLSLLIGGILVEYANDIKGLEITIDQCIGMSSKVGAQLNLLHMLRSSLDFDSRMAIHEIFIVSDFNHCPLVWMFPVVSKRNVIKTLKIPRRWH